jgi:hypothetical protein
MNRSARMLFALAVVLPVSALAQKMDVAIQLAKPHDVVTGNKNPTAAVKPNDPVLTISCLAGVDCTTAKIAAMEDSARVQLAAAGAKLTGKLPTGSGNVTLTYSGANVPLGPVDTSDQSQRDGSGQSVKQQASLAALVAAAAKCSGSVDVPQPYDQGRRLGRVAVDPQGSLLTILPQINEGDSLEVIVFGHEQLVSKVLVRRASPVRTLGAVSILGSEAKFEVPRPFAEEAPRCVTRSFFLADFAPGRGEVEITATDIEGKTGVLGRFEFPVAPLYTGMFSIGAMWSSVQDPAFGTVTNGADLVITAKEQGYRRLLYTVLYTPFVWGSRDVERAEDWRSGWTWLHHLNPSVGIVVNNVPDNGVAGVSFDLPQLFVLTYGVHVSHVSVVDPNSGLAPGSVLPAAAVVPTAKRWKTGWFWGISIDLRAAAQLFKSVAATRGP